MYVAMIERPRFMLDCCSLLTEKLPTYDDLHDEYLDSFFKKRVYFRHLAKMQKIISSESRLKPPTKKINIASLKKSSDNIIFAVIHMAIKCRPQTEQIIRT